MVEKPIFNCDPDLTNSIGTRMWSLNTFYPILNDPRIKKSIVYFVDNPSMGEDYWNYLFVEYIDDEYCDVLCATNNIQDIEDIVKKIEDLLEGYGPGPPKV